MSQVVHIVSANSIARQGLGVLIAAQGFTVGAAVGSTGELPDDADPHGVAILAELAPDEQGRGVRELVAAAPGVRPVVLSPTFDLDAMVACFREGACGYLIKDMSVEALVAAIQMISTGEKVLPSSLADELTWLRERTQPNAPANEQMTFGELKKLSPRERDVLCCLMSGSSNKVIANRLNVSEATIKVNVKAILRKLNVANRTQAALWARQQAVEFS
jgi:two-component system, NarL family, nitrate/nitrite response regulator NarL